MGRKKSDMTERFPHFHLTPPFPSLSLTLREVSDFSDWLQGLLDDPQGLGEERTFGCCRKGRREAGPLGPAEEKGEVVPQRCQGTWSVLPEDFALASP